MTVGTNKIAFIEFFCDLLKGYSLHFPQMELFLVWISVMKLQS